MDRKTFKNVKSGKILFMTLTMSPNLLTKCVSSTCSKWAPSESNTRELQTKKLKSSPFFIKSKIKSSLRVKDKPSFEPNLQKLNKTYQKNHSS